MIDAEDRPAQAEGADLTTRVWTRVQRGIVRERRRHRFHAVLAATIGGLIGAGSFMYVFGDHFLDASEPRPGPEICPTAVARAVQTDGAVMTWCGAPSSNNAD